MITVEPFVVAACVAVAAWCIAKEEIFREPRDWLDGQRERISNLFLRKLCYLPLCEFCGSFWISLIALAFCQYKTLYDDWRGYVVSQFLTWALAVTYLGVFQLIRTDIKVNQADAEVKKTNGQPPQAD